MNLWDRQPNERNLWYARFVQFRDMGPDRSLLELCNRWRDTRGRKRSRCTAMSWRRACDRGNWVARAESWDEAERARLAELRLQEEGVERKKWAARREALREQEHTVGLELLKKAQQMLMFPLATTVSEDGTTVIQPGRWSFATAANVIATADKLLRLAADMETDHTRVTLDDVLAGLPIELRDGVRNALAGAISPQRD